MKITTSASLGSLGAKEGPATFYSWRPPSSIPRLIPWVGLLLLMLLKRNRSPQAWWVAGLILPLNLALSLVAASIRSSEPDLFLQIAMAITFGVAAVWLLSPYFDPQIRFLAFLGTLLALDGPALLVSLLRREASSADEWMRLLLTVAVFGLVLSVALHLAGWSCRRRFSPLRLCLRLVIWLGACWLVPFGFLSLVIGPGPLREMTLAWAVAIALAFAMLLPFLLLSFANAFFHTRLVELLRLKQAGLSIPSPRPSPEVAA